MWFLHGFFSGAAVCASIVPWFYRGWLSIPLPGDNMGLFLTGLVLATWFFTALIAKLVLQVAVEVR